MATILKLIELHDLRRSAGRSVASTDVMRLSHRLIGSLVLGVVVVSIAFAWVDVRAHTRQLEAALVGRADAEALDVEEAAAPYARPASIERALPALDRLRERVGFTGALVFDRDGHVLARTPGLSTDLITRAGDLTSLPADVPHDAFVASGGHRFLVHVAPAHKEPLVAFAAVVVNADDIGRQTAATWRDALVRAAIETILIVVVTLLLVRSNVVRPLSTTAAWLRARRLGQSPRAPETNAEFFQPLFRELTHLVKSLEDARASAEEEARLRDAAEAVWTPERLRAYVRGRLSDSPLVVVSNREPYMHVRREGAIQTIVPASGLVTALEPILRACDGTWIAHGSGDADRDRVDARDRLRVPPDQPEYTLQRVWLTAEEEEGYYYGFSNEGLWPLCHIAHTRPLFRASDWACYQRANRRFADAVLGALEGSVRPLVLVQDYHFALLPRLIKARRPDARVGLFWHIPWPNPEAFGICPWQEEVLDGLLGADLVGFHTQAHCNNFLETVDRAFESQIEWEHFTARRHDHVTRVRPFPISVDGSAAPAVPSGGPAADALRAAVLAPFGLSADLVGVGVDRIDYTKGLIERLRGLERFFEKWSQYAGRFTFVQIGAPSRTRIPRYHDLVAEVTAEAARINARFGTPRWKPIVLLTRHHSHAEIEPYYRAADLCLVTALHDGMNLVAKEFVATRHDEDGVLVLSQFTGAARELPDALIVNPYDVEQLADTIRRAIDMRHDERQERMRRMRRTVREHNVYRWAAMLIGDLVDVRLDDPVGPSHDSRPALWHAHSPARPEA